MPYAEVELSANTIDGVSNLNVWFVEPALNAKSNSSEVAHNIQLAMQRTAGLALAVNARNTCIARLYNGISIIAVDTEYNAWLIAGIPPSALPEGNSESELEEIEQRLQVGFVRSKPPAQVDAGPTDVESCGWPEVRTALDDLMDPVYPNRGHHYYIDNEGGAIWLQWNVPPFAVTTDQVLEGFLTPLRAIDAAVTCLYPEFTTLWLIYVWPNGQAELVAAVDGEAVRNEDHQVMMDLMEVIYPDQQQ